MPPIAKRVQFTLENPLAFELFDRAVALEAQGLDMIHLELGEPDTDTPDFILEAAEKALRQGRTRYEVTMGSESILEAVADFLQRTRGVEVPQHRIAVASGITMALYCTFLSILDPGDEILLPDPGYPMYHTAIPFSEGAIKTYPLMPETGFMPDFDALRAAITRKTRAILITTPGNPTGAIFPMDVLETFAEIAIEHDLWLLSDEIYCQFYFDDEIPPSILQIPGIEDRAILIDGWSKPYSMTGWRVGFGVFPDRLLTPIEAMLANSSTCVPPFIMDAAEVAIRADLADLDPMRQMYKERRDVAMAALEKAEGLVAHQPDGAFYILIDCRERLGLDVKPFVEALLEQGVAVLPGDGMGESGRGFIRITLTQPAARIEEGIGRMVDLLNRF